MPDQKPPRLAGDDRTTLLALLQYQRESFVRKVEGGRFDDQPTVNLRWILAHLLEETARHAGHADIIRELIDGQTGR